MKLFFCLSFMMTLIGFALSNLVLNGTTIFTRTLCISLAPILGFALVALLGVFGIAFGISNTMILCITLSISLTATFFLIFRNRKTWYINVTSWKINYPSILAITAIAGLWLTLNTTNNGVYLTHRLFPDFSAYVTAALKLGGVELTAINSFPAEQILDITHRWALPYLFALTSLVMHVDIADAIFSVMSVICVFASLSIATLQSKLYEHDQEHGFLPIFFIIILFNVCMAYFLFEGFYPQVMTAYLVSIILSVFQISRQTEVYPIKLSGKLLKIAAIVTILGAFILAAYSEAYLFIVCFFVGVLILDLLTLDKRRASVSIIYLASLMLSIPLIIPNTYTLFGFAIENSANFAHVGYPMPSWSLPSDLLGLTNIYSDSALYLSPTHSVQTVILGKYPPIFKYWLSFFTLIVLTMTVWRSKDRAFFIAIIISTILLFSINFILYKYYSGVENYLFNKLSIFFSPIVMIAIANYLSSISKKYIYLTGATFGFLFIISNTLFYTDKQQFVSKLDKTIITYFDQHQDLSKNYIYLAGTRGKRHGAVVGQLRYIDRSAEAALSAMLNADFIDQWQPNIAENIVDKNREIIAIFRNDYLAENDRLVCEKLDNCLFSAGVYVALRSGKTLASIQDKNDGSFDLSQVYMQFPIY